MGEPHHVGSTFGSLPLTVCLPTNLMTNSSGRHHTCFPLNCCETQKVRSTCYQAHLTYIHRKSPLEVGYTCLMWIFMGPRMHIPWIIYASQVKMPHLWIKWHLTVRDVLLSSGTNPYVEHGRLVPDVVPFDHGKDINLPHLNFATPAYVIRRCERPSYG